MNLAPRIKSAARAVAQILGCACRILNDTDRPAFEVVDRQTDQVMAVAVCMTAPHATKPPAGVRLPAALGNDAMNYASDKHCAAWALLLGRRSIWAQRLVPGLTYPIAIRNQSLPKEQQRRAFVLPDTWVDLPRFIAQQLRGSNAG